ncbi:MAG: L-lactate dehydrogenase [Nanoarchaeota archaeon]|nr:L-lactate dehydrogenase [Nanoarchaeota archaeon]
MKKVAIVGAGFVGSTAAYAMLIQGIAHEIVIIDLNKEKAHGEAMDLEQGMQFTQSAKISYGSDLNLCQGADVIVITAGLAQKPGETRLNLVKRNAVIFKEMIPKLVSYNKDAVYLIITNPVDIMAYLTLKYSGLPANKVFGSGTSLDSARFRYYLGQKFDINPTAVHAFILGEHGDSEFPAISSATIAGMHINDFEGYSPEAVNECYDETKKAAYEIISRKGATYYAIGLVIAKIVKGILNDEHIVLPLSVHLDNYYDEGNLCMSVPCVLGKEGIVKKYQLPLSADEQAKLHNSAKILKDIIKGVYP